MKLILLVLAVCAVGRGTIQTSQLMNFGYYWRDWNVNTEIPEDAVAGGVDSEGYPTYVARSVSTKYGMIVPGKASSQAKRMWFESQMREHIKTKDVEILCVLNKNRLKWIVANSGDAINNVVGDNVLIFGGRVRVGYTTIGRKKIGNEIQVGKIVIGKGQILSMYYCQNEMGFQVNRNFEVLLYVKDESVDT